MANFTGWVYAAVRIKYSDPSDPFSGVGVPQTIPTWIDSDNYAMEYNRKSSSMARGLVSISRYPDRHECQRQHRPHSPRICATPRRCRERAQGPSFAQARLPTANKTSSLVREKTPDLSSYGTQHRASRMSRGSLLPPELPAMPPRISVRRKSEDTP